MTGVIQEASCSSDALHLRGPALISTAAPCEGVQPELAPSPTPATLCCATSGKSLAFSEFCFHHCKGKTKTKLDDAATLLHLNSAGLKAQRKWEGENGLLSCYQGAGAFLPICSCSCPSEEVLQELKCRDFGARLPWCAAHQLCDPGSVAEPLALVSSSVKSYIPLRLL